jgi:HK97 family phage prohead protease
MDKLIKDIKSFIAYVEEKSTAINEAERRIRFVISSDKIDRDNEKIEVSAVAAAIKDFAKNPVALAAHQHRLNDGTSPVIGSWDIESFKALEHTSEMDLIFATTELGEEYWQLYKSKHMRAVSIGFRPIEYHDETDQKTGRVTVYTKIELFEISACAVGANREALSKLKELDLDGSESATLQRLAAIETSLKKIDSAISKLYEKFEADIDEVKNLIVPDSDRFAKSLLLDGDDDLSVSADKAERKIKGEQIVKIFKTVIERS